MRTGFDCKDVHHLTDGLASDKGVILALPHMGNWDLAGAWVTTKLETPFTTVAERLKPESLYYRSVAYREGLGMEVLPHSGGTAFGTLARRLRDGGLICLVASVICRPRASRWSWRHVHPRRARRCSPSRPEPSCCRSLWYDDSPVMQGRVHPPVEVPENSTGPRRRLS